jgi:hypothetical protein
MQLLPATSTYGSQRFAHHSHGMDIRDACCQLVHSIEGRRAHEHRRWTRPPALADLATGMSAQQIRP